MLVVLCCFILITTAVELFVLFQAARVLSYCVGIALISYTHNVCCVHVYCVDLVIKQDFMFMLDWYIGTTDMCSTDWQMSGASVKSLGSCANMH